MFQQTICLVVRGEEVLLGIKNTGFDGGLGIGTATAATLNPEKLSDEHQ